MTLSFWQASIPTNSYSFKKAASDFIIVDLNFIKPIKQPDYDAEVLVPLHKAQAEAKAKAEAEAEAIRIATEAENARQAELYAEQARQAVQVSYVPQTVSYNVNDTLFGSIGYSTPYGNCVNEAGVNNPMDGSNPINWQVLTQTPTIGASVLFYFNHVAVVTGIWSNGDIEVRHQNANGAPHRYPRSMIRGFR